MTYLMGVTIAILSIFASLHFLEQTVDMYMDHVAIAMVIGGTLAVGMARFPWAFRREFFTCLKKIVFSGLSSHTAVVEESLEFIHSCQNGQTTPVRLGAIAGEVLRDGKELIDLGFKTDEIDIILQERVNHAVEKWKNIANYFAGLAKYPPAFGLIGTVFGLVNLMRAITEGMDPSQTGAKMAIALVATLYGLIMANFVVAPIGESITKHIVVEKFHADIALQGVLLASERESMLKAQEMLNSYVSKSQRINFIGRLTA